MPDCIINPAFGLEFEDTPAVGTEPIVVPPTDDDNEIDIHQVEMLYDFFNKKIRIDLQDDYDCKKINGATFAATWANMMPSIINSSLNAIVSLQTKETPTDRLVKIAQAKNIEADVDSKMEQIAVVRQDAIKSTQQTMLIIAQAREVVNNAGRQDMIATAQCAKIDQEIDKLKYETDQLLPSQKALTVRQTSGFDDDVNRKLYEASMNGWALVYSSGMLAGENPPSVISDASLTGLYNILIKR